MTLRARSAWAAVALLAVVAAPLWADVATPRPSWTAVQMVSEEVNVALGGQRVAVDAVFHMHNTGAAATVRMGYPLGVAETELKDFAVSVDGKPFPGVHTEAKPSGTPAGPGPRMGGRRIGGPAQETYRFQGPYKEWKVFDVPFAADEKKTVRVTYWVEPTQVKDADKGTLLFYSYTLKTGATWKGKIQQAVVRIKLDDVTPSRLVRVVPIGGRRTNGGKTLTWTFKDFKPTDNIEITYRPSALAAR